MFFVQEQTIKANTDNNDEADESDLHIFIAENIKRVRRPLSHEVGMYPISGEDKPDSAGRACVTFLGSELEVASQSALDTLDEKYVSQNLADILSAKMYLTFATSAVLPKLSRAMNMRQI